jgi:hypothetical protein
LCQGDQIVRIFAVVYIGQFLKLQKEPIFF